MRYILVKVMGTNPGWPPEATEMLLSEIGTFMLGRRYSQWMLLQVDDENETKKYIPWPEPYGESHACVTGLEAQLRQAIHSR